MTRSHDYDALIEALFEGRVDPDEATRLLGERAEDSAELEELAELVDTLARIDPAIDLPSDAEFGAARRQVLDRIAATDGPRRPSPWSRWLPLAAGLVAFAVGLAVGQSRAETAAPSEPTLADLVTRSALATDRGNDFRFSNLRLEDVGNDMLAVSVNVESDLRLVRPKNDLLVSDILASSLISDDVNSLGARLKAVRYAPTNPRVHEALRTVVLHDADMSVRLKALERLIENHPRSTETQETLVTVLENEASVVMRLLALDALADDYLQPDLLETLDKNPAEEGGNAVLWHAQQRLNSRSM